MVLPAIAAVVGGQVLSGIGQQQALRATERAYADARGRQAGFDKKSYDETKGLIDGITPDSLVPAGTQNDLQQRSMADNAIIAKAVGDQATRRAGGRNPEGLAVLNQNAPGIQHRADQDAALAALEAAWNKGGNHVAQGARELGIDRGRLAADAHTWEQMLPVALKYAGQKGSQWRQLGTLSQILGQYGLSSAMSKPSAQPATSGASPALATQINADLAPSGDQSSLFGFQPQAQPTASDGQLPPEWLQYLSHQRRQPAAITEP